ARGPARAGGHERLAAIVLGRRCGREPDAACRWLEWRRLAGALPGRPGRRTLRRRLARAELREPQSRPHAKGQELQALRRCRWRARALPGIRALVVGLLLSEPGGNDRHRRESL